jgi:hypothetical protein
MTAFRATLNTFTQTISTWASQVLEQRSTSSWGMLPLISLLAAGGVAVLSQGYIAAHRGSDWASPIFWLGVIILFLPVALRFSASDVSRREGVGLVIILAIGSYLVNYLRSPITFVKFDELLHWRTAYDILNTGKLFTPNPLLPVSPLYPGLESVANALISLGGMDIFGAGNVMLLSLRVTMLLGLFLIFERLSHSVRVAGLGTLIYMGGSTFLFFDAQFSYESLSLPLACTSIYMLIVSRSYRGSERWGWNVLIALSLSSLIPTHHMTSYSITIFLIIWVIFDLYLQRRGQPSTSPIWMAIWMVILNAFWLREVAMVTLKYITPILSDPIVSIYKILTGQSAARRLFENSAGQSADLFERVVGMGSVLLLTAGLLIGLWFLRLRYRRHALALALGLCALFYPALPLMRFASDAWEVSNRLSGFVFVALGFIVAVGLIETSTFIKDQRLWRGMIAASVTIIFLGGIVAGSSPQTRLPQPYLPAAESRSIDHQGIMAAAWAHDVLGPDNRMVGDRIQTNLMGAYGTQRMIVNLNDQVSVSGLFLRPELSEEDRSLISDMRIRYLVIDRRIAGARPILGYYVEKWEQLIYKYTPPIAIAVLDKYNSIPGVSRIFDSGDIVIYDLGAFSK